jgi:hypothetical protein
MNVKRIILEQILCHLVSPKGTGEGGYISNKEALNLIRKIEDQSEKEIKDPKKKEEFNKVIQQFKKDINNIDTNNDTVDTYLHRLRDIIKCYSLGNYDDFISKDKF